MHIPTCAWCFLQPPCRVGFASRELAPPACTPANDDNSSTRGVHPLQPLQGSRALGYVAWSWGATVAAQVGPNGRMAVTLNRAPIRQGTHKRLGALVDIKFAQDKCGRWSCAPRRLDIAVRTSPSRPFIKITIIQPWVAASGAVLRTGKAKGSYAPYLEV